MNDGATSPRAPSEPFKFDVFISYRRKDGGPVAQSLRRSLMAYRLPKSLRGDQPRALSVYLDTVYERATEDFFNRTIIPALRDSRHLIVVHSPSVLERRPDGSENWVSREVREFRRLPQGNQVSVVVPEGGYDGPLAGDLHVEFPNLQRVPYRDGRRWFSPPHPGVLQLVAALHEIPESKMPELRLESETQARKTLVSWLLGASALVGVLAVLSFFLVLSLFRAQSLRLAAEAKNALPHRIDVALRKAAEAQSMQDTSEAREALLSAFSASPRLAGFIPCASSPSAVAFSTRGDLLAVAINGEISFWDTSTLHRVRRSWSTGSAQVDQMAFSPDGTQLLALHQGKLSGVNLGSESNSPFMISAHGSPIVALHVQAADGSLIAIDSGPNILRWPVDAASGGLAPEASPLPKDGLPEEDFPSKPFFSADGGRVLRLARGNLWEFVPAERNSAWRQVSSGGDGGHAAIGKTGAIVVVSPGKVILRSPGGEARTIAKDAAFRYVSPLALSADGKSIAYATEKDNLIAVRGVDSEAPLLLKGHTHNLRSLAFWEREGAKRLASVGEIRPTDSLGDAGFGIILWNLTDSHPLASRLADAASVFQPVLAFDPGGSTLACACTPGRIDLWSTDVNPPRHLPGSLPTGGTDARLLRFSLSGRRLAAVMDDGTLAVWDVAGGPMRRSQGTSSAPFVDLAFSGEESLQTIDRDGHLVSWRVEFQGLARGTERVLAEAGEVLAGAFAATGVIGWCSPRGLYVEVPGSMPLNLPISIPAASGIGDVGFSTDGSVFAVAFQTGIHFFDPSSAKPLGRPIIPGEYTSSGLPTPMARMAVSDAGDLILASTMFESWSFLCDGRSRTVLGRLPTGAQRSESFAFGGRTKLLATVSREDGLVTWDLRAEGWGSLANRLAGESIKSRSE